MTEEASIEFRLRKIDETKYCLLDKIENNDLMSEIYKTCKYEKYKTCKYLNYVENLLILILNSYWLCFNFYICFISLSSCWYYEFCLRVLQQE